MRTKILSSIPGRIRIRVYGLLYNEHAVHFLREYFNSYYGIVLVSPNSFTGNLLVCYDTKILDGLEILNSIASVKVPLYNYEKSARKASKARSLVEKYINEDTLNRYNNEINISIRLLAISVSMIVLSILSSFKLEFILSLMIFGFGGILFLIRRKVYCIAQSYIKCDKFDFADCNLMYKLAQAQHIFIEDSILNFDEVSTDSKSEIINLSNNSSIHIVKEFRNLGLIDISMISIRDKDINKYNSYMLGIKNVLLYDNFHFDDPDMTIAIIESSDLRVLLGDEIIVFWGYKGIKPQLRNNTITFKLNEVNKIPFVVELSKYCDELAIRSENIAVTINVIGIFLAASKVISPLLSIILYTLNYLGNIFYLRIQLSHHEKEYLNEG